MERDLLELLQQTVAIEPWSGNNAYGEARYGPGASYPARVQEKVKMIRNAKGQEVVSTAQVYLDGVVPVTVKDRITLPNGTQPLIQAITSSPDETGSNYVKVVYL